MPDAIIELLGDVGKLGAGAAVFWAAAAIPEWIAERAPWLNWVLIPIAAVAFILYLCGFGCKRMEEGEVTE